MKVLHITNLYPSTDKPDYGIFVKEQIDALNSLTDVQCDVYVINSNEMGIKSYWKAIKDLRRDYQGYDIYHSHHVFSGFVSLFVGSRRKRVVSLLSNRYDVEPRLKFIGLMVFSLVAMFSSKLITKVKRKSFFGKEFEYLPNGVDTEFFNYIKSTDARRNLKIPDNAFIPLFVSSKSLDRQEKRKDLFDKFVNQFKEKHPEIQVHPVYLCNIERGLIPLYFNAASVHILTSDFEGSPNSVKEALSCGCPVVAVNVGDVPNILADSAFTLLTQQDKLFDLDSFNFVKDVMQLKEVERKKIRQNFLSKDLSKDKIVNKIYSLYQRLT